MIFLCEFTLVMFWDKRYVLGLPIPNNKKSQRFILYYFTQNKKLGNILIYSYDRIFHRNQLYL